MARKKTVMTQEALNALAERAHELSLEIAEASRLEGLLMQDLTVLDAATWFNQLSHACSEMCNALIAKAKHEADKAELTARLTK